MRNTLKYALMCAMALALLACKKDPVNPPETPPGPVDTTPPKGALWAVGSDDNAAPLFAIDKDTNIELVYRLDKAATEDITVTLTLGGQADVDKYNTAKGLEDPVSFSKNNWFSVDGWTERYRLMPATNYTAPDALTLTVPKGAQESNKLAIPVMYDEVLLPLEDVDPNEDHVIECRIRCPWMLPVKVTNIAGSVTPTIPDQSLALGVRAEGALQYEDPDIRPLDTEYLSVLYLNTGIYNPLLADDWVMMNDTDNSKCWYGNIVNLRVNTVKYDATSGRTLFEPSSDIRYVVEHAAKYIHPMQAKGRKVCISIEGGDTGLGFCNMTDTQIDDFVFQVKDFVTKYNLDGVNLFDRNSGYGKAGMADVNTTSYPKLIKKLREALGKDKLITVADYEEPTATFHDTAATGGIKVGDYIDYAWSGYMSEDEDIQLLDPYGMIEDPAIFESDMGMLITASEHTRKPFAGLDKANYGHWALPFFEKWSSYQQEQLGMFNILLWRMAEYCPNKMIVYGDIIGPQQGVYEEQATAIPSTALFLMTPGAFEGEIIIGVNLNGVEGYKYLAGGDYGYMLKDW